MLLNLDFRLILIVLERFDLCFCIVLQVRYIDVNDAKFGENNDFGMNQGEVDIGLMKLDDSGLN